MKFKQILESYERFWPYYMDQHKDARNRAFHYIGTLLVILNFILFTMSGEVRFLFFMPLFGYSFAWLGHCLFEKNKPAAFRSPLWSLFADFRMLFIFLKSIFKSV